MTSEAPLTQAITSTSQMFGILNYYKPTGITSRDCVNHIQRIIRPIKCGHAGTLDPVAEGVLIIGIGQAVRLVDWIHHLSKTYIAEFELGKTSPSSDRETEISNVPHAKIPDYAELQKALPLFQGTIQQTPPIYSAIRIGGKRAHELARAGKSVTIPPRSVEIHSFEILQYSYPHLRVRIDCSTGTYVRSLGRDLARSVGTDAIMTSLIRTRVGDFSVESATPATSIETSEDVLNALQNPMLALTTLPRFALSNEQVLAVLQGKQITLDELDIADSCSEIAVSDQKGVLQSILNRRYDNHDKWSAKRNFHSGLDCE